MVAGRTALTKRGGGQSADKAYNRKNRSDIQKIRSDFCFRRWICRALWDRQIQSQGLQAQRLASRLWRPFFDDQRSAKTASATNFAAGKISSSAALASCGHLRLSKLPWLQVQLPWLAGFLNALPVCPLCQHPDRPHETWGRFFAVSPPCGDGTGAPFPPLACMPPPRPPRDGAGKPLAAAGIAWGAAAHRPSLRPEIAFAFLPAVME